MKVAIQDSGGNIEAKSVSKVTQYCLRVLCRTTTVYRRSLNQKTVVPCSESSLWDVSCGQN